MNIFATSTCPVESAHNLPTVHVIKMILESYQILSTAHFKYTEKQKGYKPTHKNHPSTVWASASKENYRWLYRHAGALAELYEQNSCKEHKSHQELKDLLKEPPEQAPETSFVFTANKPTPAMPAEFKGDYKAYLNAKYSQWISEGKTKLLAWPQGEPDFLSENIKKWLQADKK